MAKRKDGKPSLPRGTDWGPDTRAWFKAWADSPATDEWDARQWQYMFDTALVHNMIYAYSDISLIAELRQRLAFMGLTFERSEAVEKSQKKEATKLELYQGRRKDRRARATG